MHSNRSVKAQVPDNVKKAIDELLEMFPEFCATYTRNETEDDIFSPTNTDRGVAITFLVPTEKRDVPLVTMELDKPNVAVVVYEQRCSMTCYEGTNLVTAVRELYVALEANSPK